MKLDIGAEFDAACNAAMPVWYLGAGARYQTPLDAFLAFLLGDKAEDATAMQVGAASTKLRRMMQIADVDKASADELKQLKSWVLEQS